MENFGDLIEVEILGLSVSPNLSGNGYALFLKEVNGERKLPIIIGQFEAQVIAMELQGVKHHRPLTHDLLKNIIEALGYSIESVIITDIRDSTFFAKIKFDSPDIEDIDARPSDAIALALKFSVPIYVAQPVLEEAGFTQDVDFEGSEENSELTKETDTSQAENKPKGTRELSKKEKLDQLKKDLEKAVMNEDYERAAMLRDEIKKLEISNLN
ncbi:MAG: bifunctional nuclease domain-containing protein [Ignavibacteria bacterium]